MLRRNASMNVRGNRDTQINNECDCGFVVDGTLASGRQDMSCAGSLVRMILIVILATYKNRKQSSHVQSRTQHIISRYNQASERIHPLSLLLLKLFSFSLTQRNTETKTS
jgi:hypothetical protein